MCQELRMTIRMPVHLRSDNGKIVFSRSTGVSSQFNQVSYKKISEVTEKGKKKRSKSRRKDVRDRERGTEIPMTAKQTLLD